MAASIASEGMLRRAAPITSIEKPVIDQMLATVTTTSGQLSRKFVLCSPVSVPSAPLWIVVVYQVIPAVTAGIIHETTTTPPTMTRIQVRARMSSEASQ